MEEIISVKKCPRCNIIKPVSDFANQKVREDGLFYFCRKCSAEQSHEYYLRNAENIKSKRISRYNLDPEKYRKYSRDYAKGNPEKALESKKKSMIKTADKIK